MIDSSVVIRVMDIFLSLNKWLRFFFFLRQIPAYYFFKYSFLYFLSKKHVHQSLGVNRQGSVGLPQ